MAGPILSILMSTLASRRELRKPLLATLQKQATEHADELLLEEDDGRSPSGTKRQALLNKASGEYVAFVDDDDLVAPNYVQAIHQAIVDGEGPDAVTLELLRTDGRSLQRHTFKAFNRQVNVTNREQPDGTFLYVANHLCPVRREIALAVPFLPIGYLDDVCHHEVIHAARLIRRTVHIHEPLYFYLYDPHGTANQQRESRERSLRLTRPGLRAFRHEPSARLVIECEPQQPGPRIQCHTPGGGEATFHAHELTPFHTIRRTR